MSTFGRRLKQLRIQNNLTQKDFGQKFQLSESTIGMYERDQREPSFDLIKSFAVFFEVSVDWFLGQESKSNTNQKDPEINIAYFGGAKKDLTEEEAQHLEESLEMFRALKAKRNAEKNK